MKNYCRYMDSVTVSDTLHERLCALHTLKKQSGPWKRYATAAAALALVIGIGAAGLFLRWDGSLEQGGPEIGTEEPAVEPNPMPDTPGMETMGGYELSRDGITSYYLLPAIRYGETAERTDLEIKLPEGVTRRNLTEEEIEAVFRGADTLADHLDWSGYELSACALTWSDGSLWLLSVSGSQEGTELEHFTLEIMPGALPLACVVYEESMTNLIWGQEVTAESYHGTLASTRRVSFLRGGYGYCFEITGADKEQIEVLASRLVRWVVVGDGLCLSAEETGNADATSWPDVAPDEPEELEGATTSGYDPSAN